MKESISPEEKLLSLIKGQKNTDKKTYFLKRKFLPQLIFHQPAYKILWPLLLLSCLYLMLSFLYQLFGLRGTNAVKVVPEKITKKAPDIKPEFKPFEYYKEGMGEKNIFALPSTSPGLPAGSINSDLLKNFNLIGIISGNNPQAIIEDKTAQKTYYLGKGQFLGGMQVESIEEGKAVLNYNGQRYELYL